MEKEGEGLENTEQAELTSTWRECRGVRGVGSRSEWQVYAGAAWGPCDAITGRRAQEEGQPVAYV